jgi:hypothetical protein
LKAWDKVAEMDNALNQLQSKTFLRFLFIIAGGINFHIHLVEHALLIATWHPKALDKLIDARKKTLIKAIQFEVKISTIYGNGVSIAEVERLRFTLRPASPIWQLPEETQLALFEDTKDDISNEHIIPRLWRISQSKEAMDRIKQLSPAHIILLAKREWQIPSQDFHFELDLLLMIPRDEFSAVLNILRRLPLTTVADQQFCGIPLLKNSSDKLAVEAQDLGVDVSDLFPTEQPTQAASISPGPRR